MAELVVLYNPLDPSRRRRFALPDDTPLQAWADENEPAPGKCTRDLFVNGQRLDDDAPAYMTRPGDEVLIAFRPAAPITAAMIWQAIVTTIVAMAINFVVTKLFGPSKPKAANTPSPSQVYGIGPSRNAARLGEPIPVVYGDVIVTPDYASQPYTQFKQNEQFLRAILCIGQGEFDVHEMLLGNSSSSAIPTSVARFEVFGPADHASAFGTIQAITGIRENVVTSSDVSDQELLPPNENSDNKPSTYYWAYTDFYFIDSPTIPPPPIIDMRAAQTDLQRLALLPANPPNGTRRDAVVLNYQPSGSATISWMISVYISQPYTPGGNVPSGSLVPPPGGGTVDVQQWVGPFESCKVGQRGSKIELDFMFPRGLYKMASNGGLMDWFIEVTVEYVAIDDAGAAIGTPTQRVEQFTGKNSTPQRFSRPFDVPQGRYRVRVTRTYISAKEANTVDQINWTGYKFFLDTPAIGTTAYGNVTLVAVELKASNGIASDAAASIRFRVTRKLQPPAGGALAASHNPADAFADILCAPYGGNRPRTGDELDLTTLNDARSRWAAHNGFNAIFDQPSTVWEALTLAVQTVTAAPLPIASRMSLIQDGPQPVRAQLFTDANIVRGSLKVTHGFDKDGTPAGIRIEYRDPRTFTAAAYLRPAIAPDYESVNLFGCTDGAVAAEHARLLANRRRLQRTTIDFACELEGLSCLPGDRIGVQSSMPKWGQAARVVSVAGLVLELDAALVWTAGQAHALQLRDSEGKPYTLTGVQPGPTPYHVAVLALPPWPIKGYGADMEPTIAAFGIDGKEVTDWTVRTMTPQGNQVAIQAVNYDPRVWTDTAAHLLLPLPFDEDSR